ncbi:MAG: sugar-binding domain-containing protein [Anaerostipes sp.]|nr:sugar-binding domain-containing protein [Anaerostipes sp.]MDD3747424.1 sugar-binding domain-containing protein [Anaerostipes sp.]
MLKIVDDNRLIYKVCSLYYEDAMNQQEICNYLGISRASVSRMLQRGRELGIVNIEVVNPVRFSYGELEKTIERAYGLKEVIIVESSSLDEKKEYISSLYEEAALFLHEIFRKDEHIGVTMGYNLHNISKTKISFEKKEGYTFVPIVGGMNRIRAGEEDIQSNEIAKEFADMFGGTYTQFLSPAVFSKKRVMKSFLKEESVNYIFDEFKKVSTLVMGIGTPDRGASTLLRAGYITEEEFSDLIDQGMMGDIALQFFDKNGDTTKFQEFNERVAGMSSNMMKQIENRIAIGGGEGKAKAIKGAIKGGFVNMLITNVSCAENLL